MEENKFFRFLWRGNAVFLFIAGIGLIGILISIAGLLISEINYKSTPPPSVDMQTNTESEEVEFKISSYNTPSVEDFTYFELESEAGSYGKFSSGGGTAYQTRNIGVFNLATNELKWIFPNPQQKIEAFAKVEKSIPSGDGKKTKVTTGFLITVAKSLTDNSVSRDLWIMSPDGKDFRKILSDISRRPKVETYKSNHAKLIIEAKTGLDIYPLDVDTLTLGPRTKISLP